MSYTISGTAYAAAREAVEVMGVTRAAIHKAAKAGKLDMVGLGLQGRPSIPVALAEFVWPSITKAARDLKVGENWLRRVRKNPNMKDVKRLNAAIKKFRAEHGVS